MFGYNAPTLKEYIGIPTGIGLAALAVVRNFPSPEAEFFFAAVCVNVALVPFAFLVREFVKDEQGQEPAQPRQVLSLQDEQPTKASDNIPQIKSGGMLVYSQNNETVSVNAIKAFNQHILTQYAGGLPVIMTENYWTKKESGMEQSRWVRIGGSGPTDWKDMMARGLKWGAYKTEGGQDKRVINSPRKISQLAQGYPLPTWDQLK